MFPQKLFRYCPRCAAQLDTPDQNPLRCAACQLTYFFNPTVAVAAFIGDHEGRYIVLTRATEPARGKLTIPGGFVDVGETAEAALAREVREEVGLHIDHVRFLCSLTNNYPYRDVTYPVVDLIFTARAVDPSQAIVGDGAAAVAWRTLDSIDPNDLAFPSVRHGWQLLLATEPRQE